MKIPVGWKKKFILFSIFLILIEEAITTIMTNLAPLFGVEIGQAYITASANYLDVILLHSVIVFIPAFIVWAWLLSRYDFSPNAVFLLFASIGVFAETGFHPGMIAEAGFWVFVYGLMIYLPAYSIPHDRGAKKPRIWHYALAIILPFAFSLLASLIVGAIHPIPLHF